MENSKAIELAKKLHALAERGEQGEAMNAANRLAALLQAHGLTIEDIEKPERHWCEYDIMLKHQDLFFQIVYNTVLNWDGKYRKGASKRKIQLYLTNAEQLELTAKFDHYVRSYDMQLRLFSSAFIHKHELYAKRDERYDKKSKGTAKRMSNAEYAALMSLRNGIVRDDYKQRVEDMSRLIE